MKLTGTVLRCSTRKVNSSGKETYVTNLLVLDPENSAAVARSQECSNMQGRIGMAERVGLYPTQFVVGTRWDAFFRYRNLLHPKHLF